MQFGSPPLCRLAVFAFAVTGACGEARDAANDAARRDAGAADGPAVGLDAPADSGSEDGGADAGRNDDGGAPSDAGPPPAPVCAQGGWAPQPFDDGPSGVLFGTRAGDFSVELLEGETWQLREAWTGCESYVFLNYIPTNDPNRPKIEDRFWESELLALLTEAPLNAQFFFTSMEPTASARRARVGTMRDRIEAEAEERIDDDAERRERLGRFHYVVDDPRAIEGSVGAFVSDYLAYLPNSAVDIGGDRGEAPAPLPWSFAIDRHQQWDPVGSLFPVVGSRTPTIDMTAYIPMFFNHRAAIRDRLNEEQGVDTFVLRDERISERSFEIDVELPRGPALAEYDTLEFDVTVNCPFRNFRACSEWDRIARIQVCPSGACSCPPDTPECRASSLRRELVRWITPYWRNGWRRWIMDATDVMGLLGDGGPTRFRVVMGPGWERKTERDVRIALRLSRKGRNLRAVGAELAFRGGEFVPGYNEREPHRFTPPASARRVEVVSILSGHGQDRQTGCAEWCDHHHVFRVNGSELEPITPAPGTSSFRGCAERADEGVPPGQGGNWANQRAYWCPGLPVDRHTRDITTHVNLGEENTLEYEAEYRYGPLGGGNIDLSTYVVWYE